MFYASDNAGPVHPKVMDALNDANQGYAMSYGDDPIMDKVRQRIRDIFEAPEAAVYLVATGTAANTLILSTLCQPYQTIYCSDVSHIQNDECNAPEFFTGGAKLTTFATTDGKINPDDLARVMEAGPSHGVHGAQRGPVSLTQVTECGTVYSLDEIKALTAVAKPYGVPVHLDGARFTNGLVKLGCSPAEMTWKAGVDAVSFGGTKNGLMGVEAVVFFDPKHAWEFELRRKRSAHLFSKHRYLSAQMLAYLTDDLWLDMARAANNAAADLTRGLKQTKDVSFMYEPDANILFPRMPRALHKELCDGGAIYELMGELVGDPAELLGSRLVCDWSATSENIERFLNLIKG